MLYCGNFQFDLSRPLVMGIINVTPDSFSDGGQHLQSHAALAHANRLLNEGADMLDIGGESSRPGALLVSVQEELDRVSPVIEGLRGAPAVISIDSCKPEVIQAAIANGAQLVNSIDALNDAAAMRVVASSNVAVCLMHKQGIPSTMQAEPQYQNVITEVVDYLRKRIIIAELAGIQRNRIIIDPGFGFGKTLAHNLTLLREMNKLTELGVPILAGLSRKSMLGTLTGQNVTQRLSASISAALIAVQRGATIVRVHDVLATVDALKIWNAVIGENN